MATAKYGTAQQYQRALSALDRRGIPPTYRKLLLAHLRQAGRPISWRQLGKSVGYPHAEAHKSVNLQYGSFARSLAREMRPRTKPPFGLHLLAEWEGKDQSGEQAFLMRPEVVTALQALGWDSSAPSAPASERPSDPGLERKTYSEGGRRDVVQSKQERDPRARRECLKHYGTDCVVCGKSMETVYGPVAIGLIHVHHINPLAGTSARRRTDPIRDLRPVCPNCHGVIHRRSPLHSIDEVRALLGQLSGLTMQ